MSKFSNGKWYVDRTGVVRCDDEYDRSIAFLITSPSTKEVDEANARLVVAAPELYRLLREELIPTSDYGGLLSFSREAKLRELFARIDGEEDRHE